MKRLLLFPLLFLLLTGYAHAEPRHTKPDGATALLPDLRTKQSFDLGYRYKKGRHRVLFETRTGNIGRGPFEIQSDPLRRLDCDGNGKDGDYGVRQIVYYDLDGNRIFNRLVDAWVDWEKSGCIYNHEEHSHWHFDDLNTSYLTRAGKIVSRVQKNSWCLVDMAQVSPGLSLPWEEGPFYGNMSISIYDNCSGPRVSQGISPGWEDIYGKGTPGQHIDVTKLSSGKYCLVTVVDQKGVVRESNESNNLTGTPIYVNKKKKSVQRRSGSCS